ARKDKLDADLAYYAHALEGARARGGAGRRRAGWVLLRMNQPRVLLGLASAAESQRVTEEALAIAREVGDRAMEAMALSQLGIIDEHAGRSRDAIPPLEQARTIYRELGDHTGEIRPLNTLGIAYKSLGEYQRGIEVLQEALALCDKTGEARGTITVLNNLGAIHDRLDE